VPPDPTVPPDPYVPPDPTVPPDPCVPPDPPVPPVPAGLWDASQARQAPTMRARAARLHWDSESITGSVTAKAEPPNHRQPALLALSPHRPSTATQRRIGVRSREQRFPAVG
jgi:hypothetical protein